MCTLVSMPTVIAINPFNCFDLKFAKCVSKSEALPIFIINDFNEEVLLDLSKFSRLFKGKFGLKVANLELLQYSLPDNLDTIIVSSQKISNLTHNHIKILAEVHSVHQLEEVDEKCVNGIIAKGNEAAGEVGELSSFVLLQALLEKTELPVFVQGGVGIHTASAIIGVGAYGVVLDYQCSLFPELNAPEKLKEDLLRLDGSETKIIDSKRVYQKPYVQNKNGSSEYNQTLCLSQDVGLAKYYFNRYKKLDDFIDAIHLAVYGHQRQAKHFRPLRNNNSFCKEYGLEYPVVQGPMTRVTDVPEFALSVSENGGLPFVALAMLKGDEARNLLVNTNELLSGKSWGVGLLGFNSQDLWDEQFEYIKEVKPTAVLIAGGRPSQANKFEEIGIKAFLHVPSSALLDSFIDSGVKNYVFEGRECGGHVGPFSSLVLWEKQINALHETEDLRGFNILFAGGIHDAKSAAFISIMATPLVTRGAHIGVVMGSSYLFTNEAVESGAIQIQYQKEVLSGSFTTLLESSPGHVVRCLNTPFAEKFQREKSILLEKGISKGDMAKQLEKLNVGRLRIAAKGNERIGDGFAKLNVNEQIEKGLFMIGQVTALVNKTYSIKQLHEEVSVNSTKFLDGLEVREYIKKESDPLDIAIIGMSCLFPDAKNVDEYWLNILQAKDSIIEVPEERWNKEVYFAKNERLKDKSTSKWGGFIPEVTFDPVKFGIPPQSLASIEPSQLLSLQVAYDAIVDAGYENKEFDRDNTSVIFGVETGSELQFGYELRVYYAKYFGELPKALDDVLPDYTEDSFPGILSNVISGRIANRLDFGGRNYSVDAACASSLTAVDVACHELKSGRANVALAGAVDLHNDIADYVKFTSVQALTFKGKCKTFDQDADGISLGEGVAVLVLKRLEDAIADKDKIYSIIKSVGASSDGKSLGLTAPRKSGQIKAFNRSYKEAGILPSEVGLYEAHGTGTVVGDKTELSSITELMLESGALPNQSHMGSVKTQIGHTKCAAGLAALIKASLSVYHGIKPPTINLNKPNLYYNEDLNPFIFNEAISPWIDKQRIAGISAFGFGGTNFHTVIENYNCEIEHTTITKKWPVEILPFRATNEAELNKMLSGISKLIDTNNDISLEDISYTLFNQADKPIRLCIVASSIEDLKTKINNAQTGKNSEGVYNTQAVKGKVAFLFSGQGSQRINMARDLFSYFPETRELLTDCKELNDILFPKRTFNEFELQKQEERIKDTLNAQPLLGIVDYAIASLLKDFGIEPDVLAGHSYGEIPALTFAGVIKPEELVSISKARASAILDAVVEDKGLMVAINCNREQFHKLIENEKEVYLANHNSNKQWVVAGYSEPINSFVTKLKDLNVPFRKLPVACAFHSPVIANSEKLFEQELKKYRFKTPEVEVWSNTTADKYPTEPHEIKERLCTHLVNPVLFTDEIKALHKKGARIFIETGPGNVLSNLCKSIVGEDIVSINAEQNKVNGIEKLMHCLAMYISTGREINFNKIFKDREVELLDYENLEKYEKPKTAWLINGFCAVPLTGKLPAHARKLVDSPVQIHKSIDTNLQPNEQVVDNAIKDYLANVNAIIKAQHNVMLSYLGNHQTATSLDTVFNNSIESNGVNEIPEQSSVETEKEDKLQHKDISQVNIKDILLETISDKTGYPVEMLGLEMDLEADLSIDSIKRVEIISILRKKLNLNTQDGADDLVEKLSSIKTLEGLINCLEDGFDNHPLENKEEIEKADLHSNDSIKDLLLNIVSDKTGYPVEMLGIEMDLESDLSIDSIKRVEIVNQLKSKLDLSNLGSSSDDFVEKLSTFKTLKSIINWIESLSATDAKDTTLNSSEVATESSKIEEEEEVMRYLMELVRSNTSKSNVEVLKDKRIAIIDDGGFISQKIKLHLEYHFVKADIIKSTDTILRDYDGLILVDMVGSTNRTSISDFFTLVQKLDHNKVQWIFTVTDVRKQFEVKQETSFIDSLQGFTGFLISLNKEWDACCRTIHIEDEESLQNVTSILVDELCFTDSSGEVFYINNERHISELKEVPLISENQKTYLEKESVLLVLGGAQGITAEILKALSEEMPATYILVGRSPKPQGNRFNIAAKTKSEIRKQLLQKEKFNSPKELEELTNTIYKENQILLTTDTLVQNGSRVEYYSIDVTNSDKLSNLIEEVYKKYDRIDGVVHAAGYLDDKLFIDKSYNSFERVFNTKVLPLKTLAHHLRKDIKFCIFFSSISSVLGSKGQVDYSAANNVLDYAVRVLKHSIDGQVVSINWGPWKGKGMVSDALEKDFQRRGLSSILISEGAKAFIKELKYGSSNQVVIMNPVKAFTNAKSSITD